MATAFRSPDKSTVPEAGELIAGLRAARARLLEVVAGLDGPRLMGPQIDIVNPVLWEIGHIGWFHEHWILRGLDGRPPLIDGADALWDSSAVAHATRWSLPLPDLARTHAYLAEVERRLIARLDARPPDARDVYFYQLVARHEDMHVEALAYTRQTLAYPAPHFVGATPPPAAGPWPGDVAIPGGTWRLGSTSDEGFIFDNEKWAHPVEAAPFRIARAPVTNAEFAAFVDAGGYQNRQWWNEAGWAWRTETNAERPRYWLGGKWQGLRWRRYDREEALPPHAPVTFLGWHEADAYCRWAGRRLPSEAEWEVAAAGAPNAGGTGLAPIKRRYPWGDAPPTPARVNLGFAHDGLADVAAFADGDSAFGCRQMLGNVWEWTASTFAPFPGFSPDPYKDYSQPWFGTRKVLRGGCWATAPRLARNGYRNFFTPDRTDVFAGFRTCAP
ncbi:MAG: ergothioneine biosynthesis protein EgtB [Rhodospirillales bacterium]|nr:ergothioneine biosynthesis protein EgtB [Rhodospirillales bacterium]